MSDNDRGLPENRPIACRLRLAHGDLIMQNHRVHGVSVMPGVTFVDIVYRILQARGFDPRRIRLRNLLFPEAIATDEGRDRDLRIRIGPADADGTRALLARSRWSGEGDTEWRVNLQGELLVEEAEEVEPAPLAGDLAGARERDVAELYHQARAEGIRHGPAMTCAGTIRQAGERVLCDLRLDGAARAQADRFHIHPALLDAATLAAFAQSEEASAQPFIPIFVQEVWAPRPLGERCTVHVPYREVVASSGDVVSSDYELYDAAGRFAARFVKLTCKFIRHPELISRLVAPSAAAVTDAGAQPIRGAGATGVVEGLRAMVARRLDRSIDEVPSDVGFYDLGLDSAAMLDMSRTLEWALETPLYPTLLFEHRDIDGLAAHLAAAHGVRTFPALEPGSDPDHGCAADTADETAAAPDLEVRGYRPLWDRALEPAVAEDLRDILVLGAEPGLREALTRSGGRLVEAAYAPAFAERGPDSFALDPTDRGQLAALLARLRPTSGPRHYLVALAPADDEAGAALAQLHALAAAHLDVMPSVPCRIVLLHACGVDGPVPAHAALAAAGRAIASETPQIRARAVGFDGPREDTELARIALAELADTQDDEPEVRYLGAQRYLRRYQPYDPSPAEDAPRLRAAGVYVITGGGGRIARMLAEALAQRWTARLVLVGRSPEPDDLAASIAGWRQHGADACYLQADVSDAGEVTRALSVARARYGRIDGIFHLAGTHDDTLYFRKDGAAMRAVLAPKVTGALNLDAASRDDDLDCFVLFSSLASARPNAGQIDYAYANAFLEAFAARRDAAPRCKGRTLAIAWPWWADGGMSLSHEAIARARGDDGLLPLASSLAFSWLWRGLAGQTACLVVTCGDAGRSDDFLRPSASPSASAPIASRPATDQIAIVGVAGQYPGAPDLDTFWDNLAAGHDAITEVPPTRWDHAAIFDPDRGRPGKTYGRWGGFLEGIDLFDPAFFGISRKDAERMDPQERLFLMTAWRTLEDAGYAPGSLAGKHVGVFAAAMWTHYQLFAEEAGGVAPSALHAAIPNRVSYCLDLTGPSVAVDTACSGSLTAIHMAVESLRAGACAFALAGGVNVCVHPQKYLQLAQGQFLSSDGRCRSFGADGTGYVPGEGVGAVLLKPLSAAHADGDHVYAVIRGSGLNHTGRTSGFTVPSPTAQAAVIAEALAQAGVDPRELGYIEAHGTGTAVGDPIEVQGLSEAFAALDGAPAACAIGSVKSNVGHLESAAGIAGVTKVLLQMRHRKLVPSLHAKTLNPHIEFQTAPVRVQRTLSDWIPVREDGALVAGVSSFGAGGSNAHVVLQGDDASAPAQTYDGPCLFVLSARDDAVLHAYAERMLAVLDGGNGLGVDPRALVARILAVPTDSLDPKERLGELGFDAAQLGQLRDRLRPPAGTGPWTLETRLDELLAAVGPRGEGPALDALCHTLQVGRDPMGRRLAIVATDLADVGAGLDRFLRGKAPASNEYRSVTSSDRDSAAEIDPATLFRDGRLADLAAHWAAGGAVDWPACYPRPGADRPPARIPLPTYPFRLERCWVGNWQGQKPLATPDGGSEAPADQPPARTRPSSNDAPAVVRHMPAPGVAVVTMQDRANGNSFTEDLLSGLETAFKEIAADPDVRAVVLVGSDDVFAMGATPDALERLARKDGWFTDAPFVYEGLLSCPCPVVAAIQGHASGGGLMFGLYADLVVMSREHVYSANFLRYGFTPGMGATKFLARHVGAALADEMLYTGRAYSGEELESRGVQATFRAKGDVLGAALDHARAIAANPPTAVRALKRALAARVLGQQTDVIAQEVALHDEVLGGDALRRVRARFAPGEAPDRPPAPAAAGIADDVRGQPESIQGVRSVVETAVCATLYLGRHELDEARSFNEMGVDSIGAVEIARDINRALGTDLDSVVLYDHPTIPRLVGHVEGVLRETQAVRAAASAAAPAGRAEAGPVPDAGAAGRSGLTPEAADGPADTHAAERTDRTPADASEPLVTLAPAAPVGQATTGSAGAAAPVVLKPTQVKAPTRGVDQVPTRSNDIAVIGMAGRFPDAPNLAAFWNNLIGGHDSVREVPGDRWTLAGRYTEGRPGPGQTNSKWAALLDEIDLFDAAAFNLSPVEAEAMDPEQRLFLEQAWAGLEDAGYAAGRDKLGCGVFVGCTSGAYDELLGSVGQADSGHAFLGSSTSVLAARISYFLNLTGPTMAVDTACSASLVAVHLACQSILAGECDMALAGGVALMLTPRLQVRTAQMGMLSPHGRCASFDAEADGIVMGEGVGVVVLKPLARAIADADHVHGVIRASGVNGDGRSNGLTAPSAEAQADLIARVQVKAGVTPAEIGYVEAHGTGTALGDPIEVKALRQAFGDPVARGICALGSVKTNIGHATTAAGIAGLLKVLLALRHRRLPPSLHYRAGNPKIDFAASGFDVVTAPRDWSAGPSGKRLAAVSSFGFSGTNAHLLVEEAPARVPDTAAPDGPLLVPVSAKTASALRTALGQLSEAVGARQALHDVAFTLANGRMHLPHRAAVVANDHAELVRGLRGLSAGEVPAGCHVGQAERTDADLARRGTDAPDMDPCGSRDRARMEALAADYVAGAEVNWKSLYPPGSGRRVPLPTYPFERRRVWFDAPEATETSAPDRSDPLLGTPRFDLSLDGGLVFERRIGTTDPMVAGHALDGTAVLPGAAGLAMALAAAREAGVERPALAGVRWLWPVRVDRPCTLRLKLTRSDRNLSFTLSSGEGSPAVQGTVLDEVAHDTAALDLDAIASRCSQEWSAAALYAAFGRAGLHYGPNFRLIDALRVGDGEVLTDLAGSSGPRRRNGEVHLLDAALQAIAPLIGGTGDAPALPFALDRLDVFRPLDAAARVHVVREGPERYQVALSDDDGALLARFAGVVLRAAGPADASASPAAGPEQVFVPCWCDAAPASDAQQETHPAVIAFTGSTQPLAEALAARHGAGTQVIHLDSQRLPHDAKAPALVYLLAGDAAEAETTRATALTLAAFEFLQEMIARDWAATPLTLKVVLHGAVEVEDDLAPNPQAAPLIGLAGAIAAEHPAWTVGCIDVGGEPDAAVTAARLAVEPADARLIALRGGRRLRRVFEPAPATPDGPGPFRADGVYLILGGTGGIGFALSQHLARHFGARLAWIGRRPADARIAEQIAEIEALGGSALYVTADVTDRCAVSAAVAEVRGALGAIHGAVHAAMVLDDRPLAALDQTAIREVLGPKLAGAANFVEALGDQDLDFLTFFSSAAAFVAAGGQGNYAAASSFEDAFALALRVRSGRRVSVVNWGYWGSVGAVADAEHRARLASFGVYSIEPAEGIAALTRVLALDLPQALVIKAAPWQLRAMGVGFDGLAVPTDAGLAATRAGFAELETLANALVRERVADQLDGIAVASAQRPLAAAIRNMLERSGQADPVSTDPRHLLSRHPDLTPHVRLLETAVDALPRVLAGRLRGTEVLFPKGSTALVEPVYRGQSGADFYHRLLAERARHALAATGARGKLRLLEVGAGTGAATDFVLPALAAFEVDYVYTDLSPAFLRQAEARFADVPRITFELLDLDKDPLEQGFEADSFDVVIASNVLHATAEIDCTLARLNRLLRPGGHLIANEVTRPSDFLTLTFGVTPGWWSFRDPELRLPDSPLLSPSLWQQRLVAAGFAEPQISGIPGTPADSLEQCLLTAARPVTASVTDGPVADLAAGTLGYLTEIFAELLKCRARELEPAATFETFGVDSLVGMTILERLERDLGPLPSTLLFETLTLRALAARLAAEKEGALRVLIAPQADTRHPRAPAEASAMPAQPVARASEEAAGDGTDRAQTSAGLDTDIAVVGLAGRYPGAPDVASLWRKLEQGADCITEVPPERWDWRAQPGGRRWAGFIDGVDLFDPAFFGILPRDAEKIDPQERLFLETAWELLEGAGYLGETTREPATGVFVGLMYGTYGQLGATQWSEGRLAGAHSAYWSVANRVSYQFDLQGPSFAVDSACSSSLTAVHLAAESIRRGECRMAIAGGVNLILHPAHFAALDSLNMLSADGRCKVFDARADGFAPGEGVGAVLLKPLAAAEADGDRIWGVIKGSFLNAGGKTGGYTVPNPNLQAELIAEAWRRAGIDPAEVGYIEAHGTGTELGDPIEVAALTRALRGRQAGPASCAVGSIKANIGHLEGAAGIAGLTKVLLQHRHGRLAPCANLSELNPKIDFAGSPFQPQREAADWPGRRVAGVSSFGAGGANAHVVVAVADPQARTGPADGTREELFLLSARTPAQLKVLAARVAAFLEAGDDVPATLAELAYTSQVCRPQMPERLAVSARTRADLASRLRGFVGDEKGEDIHVGHAASNAAADGIFDDADGAAFIDTLMAGRRLAKLARLWVAGTAVSWCGLWPAPTPRRAEFPTQPFNRKRYWLPGSAVAPAGSDKPAPDTGQVEIAADTYDPNAHRVGDARVVPGMVLLELARTACGPRWAQPPFEIDEVRWPASMDLDAHGARATVATEPQDGAVRFRIAPTALAARVVAEGALRPVTAIAEDLLDLAELRARCAHDVEVDAVYRTLAEGGLVHGPSLRALTGLWIGDGEALARLERPVDNADGADAAALDPPILDGLLQAVAGLVEGPTGYMPVGFKRLCLSGPLPVRGFAYVRELGRATPDAQQRRFHIRFCDDAGRVICTVEDLQITPVLRTGGEPRVLRPTWTAAPLQPDRASPRTLLAAIARVDLRTALAEHMNTAGGRCVFVVPGRGFARRENGLYVVRPGHAGDAARLAADLAAQDLLPDGLLHAWSRRPFSDRPAILDRRMECGVHSVMALATAILARTRTAPLGLVYAYDSLDGGPQPAEAAVAAALKSLAMEHGGLRTSCLGFEGGDAAAPPGVVAERLCAEFAACDGQAGQAVYRGGARWARDLVPAELAPAGRAGFAGVHLIAGGAGALGLQFARHLIAGGARALVLVGRSPSDPALEARLAPLRADGATVEYLTADVTDRDAVNGLVAHVRTRYGRLDGVIHAAGVRHDGFAANKRRSDIDAVLAPKVRGALNLDSATRSDDLAFFVLFSSLAGETGNLGQSDYAYANAFLNAFAEWREHRRAAGERHGRTVAFAWPLWRDGGMTVDPATERLFQQNWGMVAMRSETGLRAFDAALAGSEPCVSVIETASGPDTPSVVAAAPRTEPDPGLAGAAGAPADLKAAEAEAVDVLRDMACKFLLVEPADVDMDADLMETGFDSIALTDLINDINARYGLELLPTVLFECTTLSAFARHLAAHHPDRLIDHPAERPDTGDVPSPAETAASAAPTPTPTPPAAAGVEAVGERIAIVGLSARLPGAEDLGGFWEHLASGDELVGPVPTERDDLRADPLTRDLRAGFLGDVKLFDARFFGISPQEAALMDPQQRLALETAWRAVEEAGYRPSDLAGQAVGLFMGVGTSDYGDLLRAHGLEVEAHTATGIAHSILANRISHKLDLRGPSEAVDTACSSSLVAIHRAVRAIHAGECEAAIAGGVNVLLSPALFTAFIKSGMLSPDGRCKTFDAAADGYVRGEGAGAVLLKPLARALADGDHVHAVIEGSAVNHSGRTASLTAPSSEAQARVIAAAHRAAGIDPATVSYIEAHGTGTKLGDPIEVEGLKKAFAALGDGRQSEAPRIALGSVKTNLGHLEAAAGIAGLVKVVLAMRHRELPPSLHVTTLNPYLRLDATPFFVNDRLRAWTGVRGPDGLALRRAGISSFGFGGTNAHLILQAYDPVPEPSAETSGPWLLPISAPDAAALAVYAKRLRQALASQSLDLTSAAYTLQVGREALAARAAVVAWDRPGVLRALDGLGAGDGDAPGLSRGIARSGAPAPADGADLDTIAAAWVVGGFVDWDRLWPGTRPRRLSLPSFPFTPQTHWFDAGQVSGRDAPMTSSRTPNAPHPADTATQPAAERRKVKLAPLDTAMTAAGTADPGLADTPPDPASEAPLPPAPAADAAGAVADVLRARLSQILAMPAAEIPEDLPFLDLGLDSIFAMEMVRLVNESFQLDLKAAELYQYDTLAKLTAAVSAVLSEGAAEAGRSGQAVLRDVIETALARRLDVDLSFADNGLTSFDMLRVINALERRLGRLKKALLYEQPTLAELTAHLENLYGPSLAERLDADPGMDAAPAAPAAEAPAAVAAGSPVVVRKSALVDRRQLAQAVADIQNRHGKEGGLAGRDIAPYVFLGADRRAYFNFGRRGADLLAFSYVGADTDLAGLVAEFIQHARANGLRANILSMRPLNEIAGIAFTATPFGAVQRLDDLRAFTLTGGRMRRLRYMVQRFARSGQCVTDEYRSGTSPKIDAAIAAMIDRWSGAKEMVNPYVSVVRAEAAAGRLDDRHRIFLTRLDGVLQNVVIVTRLPSEDAYLLDLEFYPPEMPLGGLEYAIVRIVETLAGEGCRSFSFGASFGIKVCDSANPDPEAERTLAEFRELGIVDGSGNYRFKNKFRPETLPIYLCRPVAPDATPVADIVLMIASPEVADTTADSARPMRAGEDGVSEKAASGDAASGDAGSEDAATEDADARARALCRHGHNPMKLPSDAVDFDLVTDSWAQLDADFVRTRLAELDARDPAEASVEATASLPWPRFDSVIPVATGRDAEALLCRSWTGVRGLVLHNGLFPTWMASLAAHGFAQLPLPLAARDADGFGGDLDLKSLEDALARHRGEVAFVCVELANNALGGKPISLGNLRAVRERTQANAVPLCLDATRVFENAAAVAEHEMPGKALGEVADALLAQADIATLSLTKDFAVDVGGLVATRDPALAEALQAGATARRPALSAAEHRRIGRALGDLERVGDLVEQRMANVAVLHRRLLEAGLPVDSPAGGHCVLLDAARMPNTVGFERPRAAALAWIFRATGIRGAPHLGGQGPDDQRIRLAVPVGLARDDLDRIAARLSDLAACVPGPVDLVAVGQPRGPFEEAEAAYHPAVDVPSDIRADLAEARPSQGENLAVVREHAPEVRRHLVALDDGEVEVLEAGTGPTLLLMHGFNVGAGAFAKQFADLTRRYRLVVVHHPGVGATTASRDLSLAGLARLIAEALDAIRIPGPVHLLGTSFGGLVAQCFALAYPQRTASLILACSSYRASNRAGQINRLAEVAARDFDATLTEAGDAGRRDALERLLMRSESMDPEIGLRFLDEFAGNPDLRARLAGLAVPTLVLSGGRDTVIPRQTTLDLCAAIPNAVARDIPEAGHFPSVTHPESFAEAVVAFHAAVAAGPTDRQRPTAGPDWQSAAEGIRKP